MDAVKPVMSEKKVFVFDDRWDTIRERFEDIEGIVADELGEPVTFEGLEDYKPTEDHDRQIRKGVDEVLGVNDGDIGTSAILLDVMFEHQEGTYHCFDPLSDHPIQGQTLLEELVGSGLPVIILSRSKNIEHILAAGHEDLEWLSFNDLVEDPEAFGRELGKQLNEEFESLRYNRQTLEAIDQYAPDYDVEELSPLGTRVVILWENERVLTAFKEAKKRLNRPLRILDVGCGTGRFEELLLSHTDTRGYVKEIVAVDFVPQFLRKAQDRLAKLGLCDEVEEKVVFKRRIAEDLQLPSESFDIVLASFGLPSFSDHRRSIPEGARVLRPGGTMVLAVYNDQSLNFEYEEQFSEKATGRRRSFFAVDIDRDENTMTLPGGDPFHCYTFTPEYLTEVVEQHLFLPTSEARGQVIDYAPMETFPVIHGCTQRRFIERLTSGANEDGKPIEEPVSYMQGAIEDTSGYSRDLYQMDRELCRLSALRDRGLYINVIASKS